MKEGLRVGRAREPMGGQRWSHWDVEAETKLKSRHPSYHLPTKERKSPSSGTRWPRIAYKKRKEKKEKVNGGKRCQRAKAIRHSINYNVKIKQNLSR